MAITLETHEKRWLKNVFFALINMPQPAAVGLENSDDFNSSQSTMQSTAPQAVWEAAKDIMDAFEAGRMYGTYGTKVDNAIAILADYSRYFDKSSGKYLALGQKQIADALAAMCVTQGITWDWSNATKFEPDSFKRTVFGSSYEAAFAANEADNTAAQAQAQSATQPAQPAQPKPKRTPTVQGGVGANGRPMTHGNYTGPSVHGRQAAKLDPTKTVSNYKSAGALGQYVRDVQGPKRDIVPDQHGYIYRIEADKSKTSGNTPVAFIKPLTIDMKDTEGKVINTAANNDVGGTNRVFMGSAHGYPEAMLFWDDLAQADAFLGQLLNSNRIPSKIDKNDVKVHAIEIKGPIARIVTHKFYPVNTEFGPALICANMLNESLNEALGLNDVDLFADIPDEPQNEPNVEETQTTEFTKEDFSAFVRENINWD